MSWVVRGRELRTGRGRFAALGAVLLAFVLRLYQLAGPALRGDEAFSVNFARQDLQAVLSGLLTFETQPPLYYAGLHAWMLVAGQSEFAVRFVSLFLGVLLVPVMWRLGWLVGGSFAGALAAALLAAANPYQVWQSQDARMYSLLMAAGAGQLLVTFAIWQRQAAGIPVRRLWLAYVAVGIVALHSHYGAVFALLGINAAWAGFLILRLRSGGWSGWRRPAGAWLAAQALVLLGFLPWALAAAPMLSGHVKGFIAPVTAADLVERAAVVYSLGTTGGESAAAWTLIFIAAAGLGLLHGLRSRPLVVVPVALFCALPLAAALAASANRPVFEERYYIFVAAGWLLLVALGLEACLAAFHVSVPCRRGVGRVGFVLLAVALAGASAQSLRNMYFDPAYAKSPGWREAVAFIRVRALPGDLVVQNNPDPSLSYYLAGTIDHTLQPSSVPINAAKAESELRKVTAGHGRVWFLPDDNPAWDGQGFVRSWLERSAGLRLDESPGGISIQLYEMARP